MIAAKRYSKREKKIKIIIFESNLESWKLQMTR